MVTETGLNVNITADASVLVKTVKRARGAMLNFDKSTIKVVKALNRQAAATRPAVNAMNLLVRETQAVGNVNSRTAQRVTGMSRAMRVVRGQAYNASIQLQDFAVQVGAGTSMLQAFSQNAPQFLSVFGGFGAAIGAGVAAIPLLVLGLKQLAGVTKDSSEALKNFKERLKEAESSSEQLELQLRRLRGGFRDLTELTYADAVARVQKELDEAQARLAEVEGRRGRTGGGAAREARARIALLEEELQLAQERLEQYRQDRRQKEWLESADERGLERQNKFIQFYERQLRLQENQARAMGRIYEQLAAGSDGLGQNLARGAAETERMHANAQQLQRQFNLSYTEAFRLAEAIEAGKVSANQLSGIDISGALSPAVAQARELARQLGISVHLALRLTGGIVQAPDPERLDPRSQRYNPNAARTERLREMMGQFDYSNVVTGGGFPETSGGGGGGGGGDPQAELRNQLEQLQETMREYSVSETEMQMQAYQRQKEILRQSLEEKLLIRQEYAELMQQVEARHQDKLAEIQQAQRSRQLSAYGDFFGAMTQLAETGGEQMLGAQKAFATAQAAINSYKAFTEILADSSLQGRPFLRFTLAATALAQGLAQVRAIQNTTAGSPGGGSGGGGATNTANTTTSERRSPTQVALQLTGGDMFSRDQVLELINKINEAQEDGAVIRLVG